MSKVVLPCTPGLGLALITYLLGLPLKSEILVGLGNLSLGLITWVLGLLLKSKILVGLGIRV